MSRDFDYEFDAPEIYASFRQLYGIDLMDEDLHWWQFPRAARGCFLCRCALSEKIRLRHLDVSKCEDKAAAQRAKDAAAIPDAVGIDERLLTEQVREPAAARGIHRGSYPVPKEMHYERRDTFF